MFIRKQSFLYFHFAIFGAVCLSPNVVSAQADLQATSQINPQLNNAVVLSVIANADASETPSRQAARLRSTTAEASAKEAARNSIAATFEQHEDSKEADFRANKGQWQSPARFRMDAPQMHIQFLDHSIDFGQTFGESADSQVGYLWNWTFINGNRNSTIVPNKTKGGCNFVISPEQTSFVPHNGEIWYDQLYYNIDIRFYGVAKTEFLYDFVLYPFADVENIKIAINGCNNWSIDKENRLVTEFSTGNLIRHPPEAYQYVKGVKQNIFVQYVRNDEGYLTYKLGKYDESLPIVIH